MLKRLNIKGLILIIVSVLMAVISVFCWHKYHDYLTCYEKEDAYQELNKLNKEYNEAKEAYEFQRDFFDYYGMQVNLDDEREEVEKYERQINEQKSIITYFNKKASSNKTYSIICIAGSTVLLVAGILVMIRNRKKTNNLICGEEIIEENLNEGEENV